jgi:hypothetical protein
LGFGVADVSHVHAAGKEADHHHQYYFHYNQGGGGAIGDINAPALLMKTLPKTRILQHHAYP